MLRFPSALVALVFSALLGAASADARDLISLRADVPFSFQAGGATLPPGRYAFSLDGVELPGVLRVRSQSGHDGALVQTQKADVPEGWRRPAKLIFEKDGDHYRLSQVLDPGYGIQVLGPRPHGEPERIVLLTTN